MSSFSTSKGTTFPRYLCFFIGMSCVAFGVAITANASLGTSPISTIAYVAHRIAGLKELQPAWAWTLGATSFVLNVVFFIAQCLMERGGFFRRQIWQLPATFVFGAEIDLFRALVGDFTPYWAKLAATFFGAFVVALGILWELAGDVLYLPGDGMVNSIAKALKTPFGITKTCFDVSLTAISVVAPLAIAREIVGVREGTLIGAVMVGQFARLMRPLVPKFRALVKITHARALDPESR